MRYLIDTNIFIDFIIDDYISTDILKIVDNYENIIYVGSESIKEFIHLLQTKKIAPKKNVNMLNVFDFIENTLGFNVKFVA